MREGRSHETPAKERGPYELGQRIHNYEIVGQLGRGGFAWVYQCKHLLFGSQVAIKVIPPEDPQLARRATAEAKLLMELDHPNLVKVLDGGVTENGTIYIVMELLQGETLRDLLRRERRLDPVRALRYFMQIAGGVQEAHERAVIHRDLKPENVFLVGGGAVKVLDFGIAKFVGVAPITGKKDRMQGTLPYMSPEHLQGRAVTPQSDVFALGTMLFEALHRHPLLLNGEPPIFPEIVWRQMLMPPRLDTLNRNVPERLARTVARAIARRARERFESARAFQEALASDLDWLERRAFHVAKPEKAPLRGAPDDLFPFRTEPALPPAFSGTFSTTPGIGALPPATLSSQAASMPRIETERLNDDEFIPPARTTRTQPGLEIQEPNESTPFVPVSRASWVRPAVGILGGAAAATVWLLLKTPDPVRPFALMDSASASPSILSSAPRAPASGALALSLVPAPGAAASAPSPAPTHSSESAHAGIPAPTPSVAPSKKPRRLKDKRPSTQARVPSSPTEEHLRWLQEDLRAEAQRAQATSKSPPPAASSPSPPSKELEALW